MADASDRVIPATPRRREAARQQGSMPNAVLLAWVAMITTAVLLLPGWSRAIVPAAIDYFRQSLATAVRGPSAASLEPSSILPMALLIPTAVVVLAAAVAGIVVRVLLDGSAWRLGRAAPAWQRIDPLAGLTRIFSRQTLGALVINACCLGALAAAAVLAAGPLVGLVAAAEGHADSDRWLGAVRGLLLPTVAAAFAIAAGQWGLARLRFEQRIRMTPEEFQTEMKSMEADPKIRLMREKRPK
ncbi:MAG: EscU/YscU/HrcU family type III secretion system export apparatus switch protein [Planctomycetia bacterium]|jgi:flagellar biosynthesis protein FlhB|nr:EscU/YscU/HrcU family type III secretion system export apparatus switch protein [Planctomycetia bacterium]